MNPKEGLKEKRQRQALMMARKIADSCELFMKTIFRKSYPEEYPKAPHSVRWAGQMQRNRFTTRLSGRKHLKSTTVYGYLMWKIWRLYMYPKDWETLYISFTKTLAAYHLKNVKKNILVNPFFRGIKDLSPNSESMINYTWDGMRRFTIEPEGILSFKRGRHPDEVIADDILADPASELDPTIIEKVNRIFKEDVMSLPKEKTGELHLVGTAQHMKDIFFQLKDNPEFKWSMHPAIENDKDQRVLWPNLFHYRRLMQIRDSIGDKAFQKEYLCKPVWSAEAYISMEQLIKIAYAPTIKLGNFINQGNMVLAGFDIGKHRHPSHLAVFEIVKGRMDMIYQRFWDNCDYTKQVREVNEIIDILGIDYNYFDATRGELETFFEQGTVDSSVWVPIHFKTTVRHKMAAEFEKRVMRQIEGKDKGITLLNNQRLLEQISMVNNNLEAVETREGHADSFWSCALACLAAARLVDIDFDSLNEAMDNLSGEENDRNENDSEDYLPDF